MQRILIMGLPGSGKTSLAQQLAIQLQLHGKIIKWLNADEVRTLYNDWDFSLAGRVRQSLRMRSLADASIADYVICDFVAPLEEMRNNFAADWTIWVDTIDTGRYENTNAIFVKPNTYNFRVTEQNAISYGKSIAFDILSSCIS